MEANNERVLDKIAETMEKVFKLRSCEDYWKVNDKVIRSLS